MFVIDANLDQETRWLGSPLKKPARQRASFASLLLPVLAPEVPVLHTLEPFDPGSTDLLCPAELRTGTPVHADLRWANPEARAVNDRRFALSLATELGLALPGMTTIRSLDELDHLLANRRTGPGGKWVAKAPWSAAGRSRIFGRDNAIGPDDRIALPRLLALAGELVFEPWLDRIFDVAVCGTVGDVIDLLPPHGLASGPTGSFHGISLDHPPLDRPELDQLRFAAERAGHALHAAGYRGPFGIDAFVYREGNGRRLHPLCEINARHTFGHVAHAFGRRYGITRLGFDPAMPDGARSLVSVNGRVVAWGVL
ncbi:MAG TPA: hypothetical protein VGC41_01100 [Kofleriaceae bacterium]